MNVYYSAVITNYLCITDVVDTHINLNTENLLNTFTNEKLVIYH